MEVWINYKFMYSKLKLKSIHLKSDTSQLCYESSGIAVLGPQISVALSQIVEKKHELSVIIKYNMNSYFHLHGQMILIRI